MEKDILDARRFSKSFLPKHAKILKEAIVEILDEIYNFRISKFCISFFVFLLW